MSNLQKRQTELVHGEKIPIESLIKHKKQMLSQLPADLKNAFGSNHNSSFLNSEQQYMHSLNQDQIDALDFNLLEQSLCENRLHGNSTADQKTKEKVEAEPYMKISSFNEHSLPSCLKPEDFDIKRLEAFSPELEKLNGQKKI